MSLIAGFLVLLLTAATGAWPSARFGRHIAGPSWVGRLSLALALGAAITGLVQIILSLLGFPSGIAVPAVLAALSLGALRVAPPSPVSPTNEPIDRPGWPLTAWLVVVLIVSSVVAVGLPFSGDGSKFWAPKSRDLAMHSAAEAPSIADETQLGFHRGYPLLVPVLMAPVFGHSPPDGSAGAKLVLQGLALALLGLITAMLSATGRNGRWLAAAVLAMPALVLPEVRESLLAGGYVDGADALFLLLFVDLADRLRRGVAERSDGALAVLVGAALVSTKLEGGVELAIVMIAWLLAGPQRGGAWLRLGCAVALLAIPTIWLRSLAPADPSMSELSFLLQGEVLWGRSLPVLAALSGLLIDTSALGLAPLAILACALSQRPRWGFGPLLVLGCLAFFVLVYLSTTMHVGRHLHTSLHRLALHWIPSFALIAARSRTRGR